MAKEHLRAPVTQAAAARVLPAATASAAAEGKKGHFSRSRLAAGPWPLVGILVIQAGLSLRLAGSNTANQDEALLALSHSWPSPAQRSKVS